MKKSDDQIYIAKLKSNLKHLPFKESEDAIEYYSEYIADAKISEYNKIVNKLGTPKKLARQLEANYLINEDNHKNEMKSVNHNFKLIVTILLALSSPFLLVLAIPLLVFLGITIFGMGISILFTVFVSLSLIIIGITSVMTKGIIALFLSGLGLALLGAVLIFISLIYFIVNFIVQKLVILFKFIYIKYQKKLLEAGGVS